MSLILRKTPACLWNIESLPEQHLTAIGYGQTQFGKLMQWDSSFFLFIKIFGKLFLLAGPSSNTLLKVFLDIISNEECSTFYKPRDKLLHGLGTGHICAGDPKNQMDTCQVCLNFYSYIYKYTRCRSMKSGFDVEIKSICGHASSHTAKMVRDTLEAFNREVLVLTQQRWLHPIAICLIALFFILLHLV